MSLCPAEDQDCEAQWQEAGDVEFSFSWALMELAVNSDHSGAVLWEVNITMMEETAAGDGLGALNSVPVPWVEIHTEIQVWLGNESEKKAEWEVCSCLCSEEDSVLNQLKRVTQKHNKTYKQKNPHTTKSRSTPEVAMTEEPLRAWSSQGKLWVSVSMRVHG